MSYKTGFSLIRASDGAFNGWTLRGCRLVDGAPELDPGSASRTEAAGLACLEGVAESPELPSSMGFRSCVPSWNADVPTGSWLELALSARSGGTWTPWLSMGAWAPDGSAITRGSVAGQSAGGASVATDTLDLESPADALRVRVYLRSVLPPDGSDRAAVAGGAEAAGGTPAARPRLRAVSLAYSDPKPTVSALKPSAPLGSPPRGASGLVLDAVPRCSQMVYPNGGDVWCSPTSVSMVLGYWRNDSGPCETRVRAAVAGVYDAVYGGHGNWSFNAAYAGAQPGLEAYVARFSSLAALEPWIAAGVPVVLSVSWNNDEGRPLSGAPIAKCAGHLTTLVGFDERGDPVMNEPASPSNETVRRTYSRAELEVRWLTASGGAAYIIVPSGRGEFDRIRLFMATIG